MRPWIFQGLYKKKAGSRADCGGFLGGVVSGGRKRIRNVFCAFEVTQKNTEGLRGPLSISTFFFIGKVETRRTVGDVQKPMQKESQKGGVVSRWNLHRGDSLKHSSPVSHHCRWQPVLLALLPA